MLWEGKDTQRSSSSTHPMYNYDSVRKIYLLYIDDLLKDKTAAWLPAILSLQNNFKVFLMPLPDGKHIGKGPVKSLHNVIFIALNKFSQQMQIHPHLGY